jgi:hypothetical protein
VVAFGFFPKTLPVRGKRARVLDSLGGELPTVRRKKPRPPQDFTGVEGQDSQGATSFGMYPQRHLPLADQVKMISLLAFIENDLSGLEAYVGNAADNGLDMLRGQIMEKRVGS